MRKSLCLLILFVTIAAAGFGAFRSHHENLNMRQTRKVSSVSFAGSNRQVQNYIRSASTLAESLDAKAGEILDAMEMSPLRKWVSGVDEDNLKAQYAEELMVHMKRMTVLFKIHRKSGVFRKLNEFEFQNLLVKSDYLLSLAVSRQSLQEARNKAVFSARFATTLAEYNTERVGFDQKMIRFAFQNATLDNP